MSRSISAAEANRQFSRLLRGVREEGASYVVTAHGRPVAKIVPVDAAGAVPPHTDKPAPTAIVPARDAPREGTVAGERLSLEQLWQRARRLGAGNASESTAIVRADRDARERR